MLRIVHTSDWHLGHALHDRPRLHEHRLFLAWLRDLLREEGVHALVVAGDLFDTANAPAAAQALLYGALAELRRDLPDLAVVLTAGNHDAAARLDAPDPLLSAFGIRMVGSLRSPDGTLDPDRLLVPARGSSGEVEGWIAAVPFLRPADLDPGDPDASQLAAFREVARLLAERAAPGQARIATGHLHALGAALSEDSERRVQIGNLDGLDAAPLAGLFDYLALGHLHRAQRVGGLEHVRYSGSPVPLSLQEWNQPQKVLVVDFEAGALVGVREAVVPRTVERVRVPASGSLPLEATLEALRALPPLGGIAEDDPTRPYLEVSVSLPPAEAPRLSERVAEALEGRLPRLARLARVLPEDAGGLPRAARGRRLADIDPAEILGLLWERERPDAPLPDEARRLFLEVLDEVRP